MRGLTRWAAMAAVVGAIGCARNHAPPQTIALRYEGPIQSRDVVEGGRIYITLCTACHRGRVNPRGYTWSAGQMRHQIREGNRLMPPLNDELLSDSQVEAVLAYLKIMGALEGDLPPIPSGDEGLDLDDEDEVLAELAAEAEAEAQADAAAAAEAAALAETLSEEAAANPTTTTASSGEPEVMPLAPDAPEAETGESLAPPGGSDVTPSAAPQQPPAPEPITDGTTVGSTVLKALPMTFVFSNVGNGSEHRLRIQLQPARHVSLRFQGLRVDGSRVAARRWRAGDGQWTEGDQPLQVEGPTTVEVHLTQPVRGSGSSFEVTLTVDGTLVVLPVPTRTSHETSLPI